MATAYGVQLSATLEATWRAVTSDLTDEQFRHGVVVVLRTWQYTRMPPPAVLLDAAYTAPLPQRDMTRVIRPSGEFWESEAQRLAIESIVESNPRHANETAMQYIARLTRLSGLTS